jgi:hypothetical protein
MAEADWRTLVAGWFPELCDAGLRQVSWPVIEPHRDYIAGQLAVGVSAATIHQRLVDKRGSVHRRSRAGPVDRRAPRSGSRADGGVEGAEHAELGEDHGA